MRRFSKTSVFTMSCVPVANGLIWLAGRLGWGRALAGHWMGLGWPGLGWAGLARAGVGLGLGWAWAGWAALGGAGCWLETDKVPLYRIDSKTPKVDDF